MSQMRKPEVSAFMAPARRKRHAAAIAVLSGCALASSSLVAGTLSGSLQSQIVLTAGCVIVGGTGATSSVNFGILDFGTHPGTFTGIATATPTAGEGGSGPTQIACSPDIGGISITVSAGSYAGQGSGIGVGTRAMRNTSTAAYLPYEVYRDAAYTQAYPAAVAVTGIAVPVSGAAFTLPIYGRVNKTDPAALPAGTYSDTLQVVLTY